MDVKKLTRNPLIYVALIGVLLFGGFLLISNLGRAQADHERRRGSSSSPAPRSPRSMNTDGDQRVDMTLSKPFQGSENVQFYYVDAQRRRGGVTAINEAAPKDGFNDAVPRATWFDGFLSLLLPLVLLGLLFWWLLSSMQGGGGKVMQFGKSKAKLVNKETPTVTFADVAGADEAIEELHEIKEFLQDPAKFQAIGARIPKGVLLYGPPGTARLSSPAPSPARPEPPSTRSPVPTSSRCSSASVPRACATSSARPRRTRRPSLHR